jgi:catechol 2,3-dioxygenase-like lactoylglutathione lyase family enzyme
MRRLLIGLVFLRALSASVSSIDSIAMSVWDLDRSVEFYTKVLTFEKESEREVEGENWEHLYGIFGMKARIARLRLGNERLELMQFIAPEGRPIPVDSRSNDRWFQHVAVIVSDMDAAYARLRAAKVRHASPSPQRLPEWNKTAGGIRAFYFRDPDGHSLEILWSPEGKGNPKWHKADGRLFLGIDHTAIVVSDTEASLELYRDLLGMHVAGESENYGPEQERLNNVFGAHLRITAMRAESGPGIEFLEYVSPRDGRPYPPDAKANDLFHWQTNIADAGPERTAALLRNYRVRWISSGIVIVPDQSLDRKSFLFRDPDGHAVQIAEVTP